jgi:hypothetical protein
VPHFWLREVRRKKLISNPVQCKSNNCFNSLSLKQILYVDIPSDNVRAAIVFLKRFSFLQSRSCMRMVLLTAFENPSLKWNQISPLKRLSASSVIEQKKTIVTSTSEIIALSPGFLCVRIHH